jgi:muramidase (phage lysozyme)
MPSLDIHPNQPITSGRYTSTAAGAYQFLTSTWNGAARELRLQNFGPEAQDQAALYLVESRGVLALFDREGLTARVLARLAPEWASLPNLAGRSHYSQPVVAYRNLKIFYEQQLSALRQGPAI